ncbi:hypothetical protein NGI44_22970, partial [Escherichia coli]|nr:hypothetical protein [Escherichia coli]
FCISQFRYSAQIRPSSVVTKDYTFKRPGWAGRFDQEGQHQDYDMDAIVGGAHNGAADAMRHCYLMCRMTKTFGSTIADVIGKN